MANLLGSFLASGGNLTPDDINPGATDDAVSSSLRRWQARGRRIPFGMDEAQFREYVRRVRERPGQQNAILAEMGFAGAGNDVRPTARGVTTLPIGSDGIAAPPPLPETGGGPGAGTALANLADAFRTPPTTPSTERPFDLGGSGLDRQPPPERNPWTTTVNSEPPATNNNFLGRALADAIPESATVPHVVNPGLLAGLGPPLPPPQVGWVSNPLGQRPPSYGQRPPSYGQRQPRSTGRMFG